MVLYFSGTGNSKYVAKRIAEEIGDEIVSINDKIKSDDNSSIDVNGKLIFALPTYAWRIPRVVEKWIKSVDFKNVSGVWFAMTCGGEIGNAAKFTQTLAEDKGWKYMGTVQIKLPDNYILMFDAVTSDEIKKLFSQAEPKIDKAADDIANGVAFAKPKSGFADSIKSSIVNSMFYKHSIKSDSFKADDKCTSCGKCVSLCPLNNIKLENNKPVWGDNCTQCMACISFCPVTAIEYGTKTVGKARYRCEK